MSSDPLEIVFYIHGVIPEREVTESHQASYGALHAGIRDSGADPAWPVAFGGAEWGWEFDDRPPESHRALTAAQSQLGDPLFQKIEGQRDLTLNPARLLVNKMRELVYYGFGDMFYYVCADGKWAIRHEIADQILQHVEQRVAGFDGPLSLTLIGHSAGSVVAFDFLYYVFSRRTHRFLREPEGDETVSKMQTMRQLAADDKLRLRRLYTFGSPISLVAFRADALVEIFARGDKLCPADYGLESELAGEPPLSGPRWINIWDKDDPISWPIEPIMESDLAQDIYCDVSDAVSAAHTAYWNSPRMHRIMASTW